MAKKTALILAGAVAKGAFEAGVLDILSKQSQKVPIFRIVATSSGALNGAVYAAGIRGGMEQQVAGRLVELWLHEANWHNVLKPSLTDFFHAEGLGTADRLLPLMQAAVGDVGSGVLQPVELRLVLTALAGEAGDIGGERATTFEHVAEFQDDQLDTKESRDKVFRTALGSAAFPALFAPVDVPDVGSCVDGGAVNNTPIKHAIEGGGVDRIIVVSPEPREIPPLVPLRGVNLISQLAEILINERLYRDLHVAETVNGHLKQLDALGQSGVPLDAIQKVKDAFGWAPLEVVQVRPPKPLDGNAFSAFRDATQMNTYVEAGRAAASAVLDALGR